MQRKPRILTVGSFVMDVIATTDRVPAAGQTVYGRDFHMAPGGKGANQALQCARLGADVTMMGCVGDDLFGEKLLGPMRAAGVQIEALIEYVKLFRQGDSTIAARKSILVDQRDQLLARMAEMQASLDLLNKKIDGYEQKIVSAEQRLRLLHTAPDHP